MFLPVSAKEMRKRGWDRPDFVYVTGDAYVDHPSFGHAIISRVLEDAGFRVAILAQPDWTSKEVFAEFGEPKLGILVSSGVVDSMVNHYTAAKKKRHDDAYSPGGKSGCRPDRAIITYCNRIRAIYKDTPLIIGGVEAGLRRFAHYDYWDDRVRRSVLIDAAADMILFGMGERAIVEVAERLRDGEPIRRIQDVRGSVCLETEEGIAARSAHGEKLVELPSYDEVACNKQSYAKAFMLEYQEQDPIRGTVLYQRHKDAIVMQNPMARPLSIKEMDRIYALPYERNWHPQYDRMGGIPALAEVKFSITSHRGCFGGCSFCALHSHQGRIIQKRSIGSVLEEARKMVDTDGFSGYIHDVGGPSANFHNPSCKKQLKVGTCKNRQCLFPRPCKNLIVSHTDYLNLLKGVREIPGVKKVFVRSGIRYDYLMHDPDDRFLKELCANHISGQLKVAPEHVSKRVLGYMGKPGGELYDQFCKAFTKENMKIGKKQFLVPYLISGHPGSTLEDAVFLAEYLNGIRYSPEQVQDFYPTPDTLSTCMYYTGIDPRTMKKVHVPNWEEKGMQRALLQYRKPENKTQVIKALGLTGRRDLIGFAPDCLVRPERENHFEKGRGAGSPKTGRDTAGASGRSGGKSAGRNAGRTNRTAGKTVSVKPGKGVRPTKKKR